MIVGRRIVAFLTAAVMAATMAVVGTADAAAAGAADRSRTQALASTARVAAAGVHRAAREGLPRSFSNVFLVKVVGKAGSGRARPTAPADARVVPADIVRPLNTWSDNLKAVCGNTAAGVDRGQFQVSTELNSGNQDIWVDEIIDSRDALPGGARSEWRFDNNLVQHMYNSDSTNSFTVGIVHGTTSDLAPINSGHYQADGAYHQVAIKLSFWGADSAWHDTAWMFFQSYVQYPEDSWQPAFISPNCQTWNPI